MRLLSEEEARHYLGVEREEMQRIIKRGKLTAYRVGGTYLRFRKDEVLALKSGRKFVPPEDLGRSTYDQVRDFCKFYGFYIFSLVVVLMLALLFYYS